MTIKATSFPLAKCRREVPKIDLLRLTGRHYRFATETELAYATSFLVRVLPEIADAAAGFRIVSAVPP